MNKETHTHYISVRINSSMYEAIRQTAEQERSNPSKIIRQIITDKLQPFGTT